MRTVNALEDAGSRDFAIRTMRYDAHACEIRYKFVDTALEMDDRV